MTTFGLRTAGAVLIICGAAQAADPASGTLTVNNPVLEFGGGPFVSANITPLTGGVSNESHECLDPVLQCDLYDLTVDLPEDIAEVFPSALIRMSFVWDDISGAGVEDFDIFLLDGNGNEVNSAATFSQPEVMVQLAQGGMRSFVFHVVPFTTVGASYEAVVELDLGEPAEGADVEAFLGGGLLSRALDQGGGQPAAAAAASAAGALGPALLLTLVALGRRRRRG